jgi:hypothetical protein
MSKPVSKICSICQEKPKEEIKLIDCTHEFCEQCIKQWVQIKQTCPNCRSNITEQHEIELFGQKISPEPELEIEFEEYSELVIRRVRPVIARINNRPEFMAPIFWVAPRQRRNGQQWHAAIVVMEPANTPVQSRPGTA